MPTAAITVDPEEGFEPPAGRSASDRPPVPARSAPRPRASRIAPYQIALTICPACERGWHDAGGRAIAVPDSTIEQALCDAQFIGRTDLAMPARATQEIPPATARLVLRRDRGCCRVPGCRSARWLHIHHIVPRERGGSNDPSNLTCLCFAHHQALHQGKIAITGTAPDGLAFDLSAYVSCSDESPSTTSSSVGSSSVGSSSVGSSSVGSSSVGSSSVGSSSVGSSSVGSSSVGSSSVGSSSVASSRTT